MLVSAFRHLHVGSVCRYLGYRLINCHNNLSLSSSSTVSNKLKEHESLLANSTTAPASNQTHSVLDRDTSKANQDKIALSEDSEADAEKPLGPCLLGLFAGNVNKKLLTYPEIGTTEELEALHKSVEPVEKFFADNVNSADLDSQSEFLPPPLLAGLRNLGLFGSSATLSAVAQARLAECLSADASIELTLRAHNSLGVRALLEGAKPELLQRLAPSLASGDRLAAFCLTEPGGGGAFADPLAGIRCQAEPDVDGNSWRLNGTKVWIANAPVADAFVVLAVSKSGVSDQPDAAGSRKSKRLTAFLVERGQTGVSIGPREVGLGVRSAAIGALHLDNVMVPIGNILGEVDEGQRLLRRVVASGRLAAGAATVGRLKRQFADTVQLCRSRRPDSLPALSDFPMVQRRLARMAGLIYATESVAYQLAFLADQHPDADLSPESAALSLLSTRASLASAADAALLAGGRSVASSEFQFERQLRDALALAGVDASPDLIRLQLAGRGAKYAASVVADSVNRFMAARSILEKMRLVRDVRIGGESHQLAVHWHHNLAGVANSIEINLSAFTRATRYCLHYFRNDLPQEQLIMHRMAECSVDLFTLLACCARASRSKSIGLRSADNELELVVMLGKEAALRLEHNIAGLNMDTLYTRHADSEYRRISDYACKFGGYAIDHALSRNWN